MGLCRVGQTRTTPLFLRIQIENRKWLEYKKNEKNGMRVRQKQQGREMWNSYDEHQNG